MAVKMQWFQYGVYKWRSPLSLAINKSVYLGPHVLTTIILTHCKIVVRESNYIYIALWDVI